MLKHALKNKNPQRIFMFIGGSATNDGGIGMASSLGVKFHDLARHNLEPIGENLSKIAKINSESLNKIIKGQ